MAILAIPFTSLSLVAHTAGGAIMRDAGGYIAGTYIDATIVQAFTAAGTALQSMGTSAVALASNPYVVGAVVIGAVAVGAYCYFHGIPAPVAETLAHAGLGTSTKKGLMISAPKLAVALVLLGAAGYVTYRFYRNFKDLHRDEAATRTWHDASEAAGHDDTVRNFGADVWATVGKAVWQTKKDVARSLATMAQEALRRTGASVAYDTASESAGRFMLRVRAALRRIRAPFPLRR